MKDGKEGQAVLVKTKVSVSTRVLMPDLMAAYLRAHRDVKSETEGRIIDLTKKAAG